MASLLLRSSRALAPRHARLLCSDQPPILSKVRSAIERVEDIIGSPGIVYTTEQFDADLKAKSVDTDKLKELAGEDVDTMKSMMMMINKMNTTALPTPQKPDFEKFSGQLSEDVLGKFKAILSDFENKIESQEIYDSAAVKEIEAQQKKMHSMFEGQDGLFEEAARIKVQTDEQLKEILKDLKLMETQIQNIRTVTIAEMLEQDPAMRKEIEAELDAHNWSPTSS